MRGRGFLLGSTLGELCAVAFIVVVVVSGASTHRISLIPAAGQGPQTVSSPSSQVVGPNVSTLQSTTQGTGQGGPTLAGLGNGGSPLIQTITTLLVAAAIGALFYGLYTRRVNAE
jgi:hypothetical protein